MAAVTLPRVAGSSVAVEQSARRKYLHFARMTSLAPVKYTCSRSGASRKLPLTEANLFSELNGTSDLRSKSGRQSSIPTVRRTLSRAASVDWPTTTPCRSRYALEHTLATCNVFLNASERWIGGAWASMSMTPSSTV